MMEKMCRGKERSEREAGRGGKEEEEMNELESPLPV